jgi:hypothetical protein
MDRSSSKWAVVVADADALVADRVVRAVTRAVMAVSSASSVALSVSAVRAVSASRSVAAALSASNKLVLELY